MDRRKRTARTVALMSLFSMTDTQENVPVASFDGDGSDLISLIVGIDPVQAGSGDPSPDNVRPISGWTGAKVTRTGKNLVGAGNIVYGEGYNSNGDVETNPNRFRTEKIPCYGKTAVSLSWTNGAVSSQAIRVIWDEFGNVISRTIPTATDVGTMRYYVTNLTSFNNAYYIAFAFYSDGGAPAASNVSDIMCEFGNSPSDYVAYQGQTYSITFPSSAGTVYGGTLDVTTGKLTVDRAMVTLTSDMAWQYSAGTQRFFVAVSGAASGSGDTPFHGSCNVFKAGTGTEDNAVSYVNASFYGFAIKYPAANGDMTAWKQFLSNNTVSVVYPLATPIEVDLTPTQVTTLIGTNNIWADTGDIKYIEYNI